MASEIRVNKINSQTGVGTITLSPTGVDISGITTAATLKVGTGATVSSDGDAFFTGVCTATSFVGSGANLTGISGVSVANQSDNRLITATGTTDALNGESGATYDGTDFTVSSGRLKLTDESSGDQLRIGAAGDFTIEHDGSNSYLKNVTGDLSIQNDANIKITAKTGGTERFKVDSSGNATVSNGNLVIGTSGKGIDFSAESGSAAGSSSALLDDYEQGSFTATMSNGVTLHSGNDVVYYIKVGNLVTIQAEIRINSSNSNSDAQINNLPFVATNHSTNFCPGPVGTYDHQLNSGTSFAFVKTTQNQSTASFQCAGQDGTFRNLDAYANGYLAFTLVYFTTF